MQFQEPWPLVCVCVHKMPRSVKIKMHCLVFGAHWPPFFPHFPFDLCMQVSASGKAFSVVGSYSVDALKLIQFNLKPNPPCYFVEQISINGHSPCSFPLFSARWQQIWAGKTRNNDSTVPQDTQKIKFSSLKYKLGIAQTIYLFIYAYFIYPSVQDCVIVSALKISWIE